MTDGVPVVAMTSTHAIEGEVWVNQRLQEVLNDPITDYLQMGDVSVVRLAEPNVTIREFEHATVAKGTVAALIINSDEHEAPQARQAARTLKASTPVFLAAEGIEIEGRSHLSRAYENQMEALTLEFKLFFPITEASIRITTSDADPIEVPVVLVNKSLLSAFSIEGLDA